MSAHDLMSQLTDQLEEITMFQFIVRTLVAALGIYADRCTELAFNRTFHVVFWLFALACTVAAYSSGYLTQWWLFWLPSWVLNTGFIIGAFLASVVVAIGEQRKVEIARKNGFIRLTPAQRRHFATFDHDIDHDLDF